MASKNRPSPGANPCPFSRRTKTLRLSILEINGPKINTLADRRDMRATAYLDARNPFSVIRRNQGNSRANRSSCAVSSAVQEKTWQTDSVSCSIDKTCWTYWPVHKGRRNRAIHPLCSCLFSRVSVPPWASAIWRLSTRPIPEPPGLVVKNGTKRLAGFEMPGPSSITRTSQ